MTQLPTGQPGEVGKQILNRTRAVRVKDLISLEETLEQIQNKWGDCIIDIKMNSPFYLIIFKTKEVKH